eukprot:gb/GFBE01027233.1/.p1 GENE.gb/GFBE01027233.1/~~gb/GFBE01027233.1/.p1  ORF type:complete len:268 (+),score=92.86 gb/GFBE01027233.1/:1-804(+)
MVQPGAVLIALLVPTALARWDSRCYSKIDGSYCKDNGVLKCEGQKTVDFTKCAFYEDCDHNGAGAGVVACVEDVCDDKVDGSYCKGDRVVHCQGQKTVKFDTCAFYEDCQKHGGGLGVASCTEDSCDEKADGFYCEDDHVIQCQGQATVNFTECAFYQDCDKNGGGLGVAACVEDACDDKADGSYCEDDRIVECQGQKTVNFTECPARQECKKHGGGYRVPACVPDDDDDDDDDDDNDDDDDDSDDDRLLRSANLRGAAASEQTFLP